MYVQGAGFGQLCNSSTASGVGTPELYSSNFGTTLFRGISYGVTAETKCKIYTAVRLY